MNLERTLILRLWNQAKLENRRLRSQLHQEQADLRQARIDLAVANVRADKATARADALESANDGLRADLSSWMDKREVRSDG